jgi:superfamily II DNA or RNA helicase/HKD family nuclease
VTSWERGLYESLITEALNGELAELASNQHQVRSELRAVEAPDRLALYLGKIIERAIASLDERERAQTGVLIARRLIETLCEILPNDRVSPSDRPIQPAMVLRSITTALPDGTAAPMKQPLIPLLDTTLLTNAPDEPRVGSQVEQEIHSADRIDVVMAFIRFSGISPLLTALKTHCQSGRQLRILTTTYTGSTEARALDALQAIGADIRVSYDVSTTRLHAKAWLFHRSSGYSTTYIGSSNLTHSAQVTGLEWNVRLSATRNPTVIDKVGAVFESYWHNPDFEGYDRTTFLDRLPTSSAPDPIFVPTYLRAEPFQERLLEQIALARQRGEHSNLLVAATGTGKTVMAALDYVRLVEQLPRARLLFVAHREEILQQSRATFRQALQDPAFGELWVGAHRPTDFQHVFASIQSLSATGYRDLPSDHFDVVVVDEFHHAAAVSYVALLNHLRPRELLGLTATPERTDGLPILTWFGGSIAAELRVWDAIDQQRLSPFEYFGIHDGLDLREVPWRRGTGYDAEGLTNLLTSNDLHAHFVVKQLIDRVGDPSSIRALGFCVSIEHARYMARIFNSAGISSVAIWSDTGREERVGALKRLADGSVNVVFSVDLFNEGVDVPTVDTLIMLRPTDSATLFLQQLGRGLRKSPKKRLCTILDFVGHHRKEFRFDHRFRALLGGTKKELLEQIEQGFPFLPAGCHMELDRVASQIVLANIRGAIPTRRRERAALLRSLSDGKAHYSLSNFLSDSELDLDEVYIGNLSWSDLCEDAGLPLLASGSEEAALRRACGRLLHLDDRVRIDRYLDFLAAPSPPNLESLGKRDLRLLRMLVGSMVETVAAKESHLVDGVRLLWEHAQVRHELQELFAELRTRIRHLSFELDDPAVPLQVHARYTRNEILASAGIGEGARFPPWQSGVFWAKETRADLLAFTLDKSAGTFSPTTRYKDYAISTHLIHWESQSTTRADSATGLRYQHHAAEGSTIFLFARHRTTDRAFYFLGPASYVSHESERPMSITWRLQYPLPGDLFAEFAAAVA